MGGRGGGDRIGCGGARAAEGGLYLPLRHRQQCCVFSK